ANTGRLSQFSNTIPLWQLLPELELDIKSLNLELENMLLALKSEISS
ncbi:9914_t:CDS:1, partial [Cetraspora pellucida]